MLSRRSKFTKKLSIQLANVLYLVLLNYYIYIHFLKSTNKLSLQNKHRDENKCKNNTAEHTFY